jgi:hypothetical protein
MRPLLALLVLTPFWASAYDFKGVEVGKPATPALIKEKLGVECGAGYAGIQVCNGLVTVAREPAKMNLVIDKDGIVQRIHLMLEPSAFETIAPLLVKKFGSPTTTKRDVVQNRMGAKFDQVDHYWINDRGEAMSYGKYGATLDSSSPYIGTKADRDKAQAPKQDRRGDL